MRHQVKVQFNNNNNNIDFIFYNFWKAFVARS